MTKYPKTDLPSILSVRSIISVWHYILKNQSSYEDVHDHPELLYVAKGHHSLLINGIPFELDAGQMVIYAPNSLHSGPVPSKATIDIVSFEVDSRILEPYYDRIITLNTWQRTLLSQIITVGTDIFDRLCHKNGLIDLHPFSDIGDYELQKLKHQLELFLIDICNFNDVKRAKLNANTLEFSKASQFEALTAFMEAHINTSVTLEQLSKELSMSVTALTSLCQEMCGYTPIAYFISMKIDQAKYLIRESSLNFTQISELLGYSSLQYFSKQFKIQTGMTPSEFAKSLYKQ